MKKAKRFIACMLSVCMLLGAMTAYADEQTVQAETTSETETEVPEIVEETEVKTAETEFETEIETVDAEEVLETEVSETETVAVEETEMQDVIYDEPELFKAASGAIPITDALLNQLWCYKQSIPPHSMMTITLNGRTSGEMCNTACGQCTYMVGHYVLTGEHLDFMTFVTESFGTGFYTGINSSYEYVANDAYPTKAWYEQKYKVTGHHVDNNWASVKAELKQGHPIVFWVRAPNHFQIANDIAAIHYIIALSYSDEADRIFIWNPNRYEGGQGWFSEAEFNAYVTPRCTEDNDLNKLPWAMERYVDRDACKKHAVTALKADAEQDGIRISWKDEAEDICTGYYIYGINADGKYHWIGSTDEMSFVDQNASKDSFNSYWVVPYYKDGGETITGVMSGPVAGYPAMNETLIRKLGVENLKANGSKDGVTLTWKRIAGPTGYAVYGKTQSGKLTYLGVVSGDSYLDRRASGTEYNFYWVYPYYKDAAGKVVLGKVMPYVYSRSLADQLTPIQGLRANGEKQGVRLMWDKMPGAEGYLIYGKTATGKYGYKGMTANTTYLDQKASTDEWTFYWVFPYKKDIYDKMLTGGTAKYVYGKKLK